MPNIQRATAPLTFPDISGPRFDPMSPVPAAPTQPLQPANAPVQDSARFQAAQGQALPSIALDPDPPQWSAGTKAAILKGFQQGMQQNNITPEQMTGLLRQLGISSLEITPENIQNPAYADEIERIQKALNDRLNHPDLRALGQGHQVGADGQFGKGSVQAMAWLRDSLRGQPVELDVTPIRQQTRTGCYRTAEAMMYNILHGKDGTADAYSEFDARDRIRDQDMEAEQLYVASSENGSGRVSVSANASKQMLTALDSELDAGRPAIAGVSYRKQNGREYNEGVTDHFVLITGRGQDDAGTYYTFQDPAGGGTHKLRLDPATGRLSGKGDMVGTYDVTLIKTATSDAATHERYRNMGKTLYSQGQRSADIGSMQRMLTKMGYDTKGATGAYGNGTAAAVSNFQQAHNLPVTGSSVDTKTMEAIQTAYREHQAANPSEVLFANPSNSPELVPIQKALTALGFNTGGVRGSFGPKTEQAIKDFQTANQLPVSGKLDNQTWLKILELAPRPSN